MDLSHQTSSAPATEPTAVGARGSGAAGGGEGAGEAGTDPAARLRSKHTRCRGDDGRGKRPRKGDAKRERKKRALAQAAETCQYYVDDHGTYDNISRLLSLSVERNFMMLAFRVSLFA